MSKHRIGPSIVTLVAPLLLALLLSPGCATGPSREVERRRGPMHHYRLGVMYYEQGQVQKALGELERSIRLDDQIPRVHFYRGYVLWNLARYQEAIESFRSAIRINPLFLDARLYLATCLEQLGRPDEALRELDAAIAVPGIANIEQARVNKALILERQGRLDEAILELRRAVTTRPRYHRAHYEMARLLEEQGRFEDALAALDAAAPGYADDAGYHLLRGSVLFRLMRTGQAASEFQRVLELAPGSEAAERAQEMLKVIG